ncbi:multipass membrane protein [Candidatus Mancarchaeum acidiphilum]|uniref:Multipass membrane protein n=1 Tax=Candidatus Mancarchaeum acidiphilum TaxID=1920749 RepID=A0A218NN16_9ARCH|nr:hypothetical protein [Candidatus Mancarchaeum acidiphilum]ASI13857.1 multipass membrane protein [Candidatus Mancarchaeum acidiphilum]
MLGYIIIAIFLIFDFVISLWDAYASGVNKGMLEKKQTFASMFTKVLFVYAGVGIAFFGMTYVLVIILSLILYAIGYIGASLLVYTLNFSFLVFGLMIISFGVLVTVQSILVAVHRRSLGSIAISIFNVIIILFDISMYASGFKGALRVVRNGRSRSAGFYEIIIAALILAYVLIHTAYKKGINSVLDKGGMGVQKLY